MTSNSLKLSRVRTLGSERIHDLSIVNGRLGSEIDGVGIDLSGLRVAPGYIDLQVNGGWGIDLQQDPARVWELGERLVTVGVTSFCPTLTSDGTANLGVALEALELQPKGYCGAQIVGWHLEGPWLNPARRGAHSVEAIAAIDRGIADGAFTIESLAAQSGIAMVTLAPELPGAMKAIAKLAASGVTVSLGHSEATMAVALEAFKAGATMGTHLFNAMPGLHHRTLGLATALLLEGPAVGLIADGVHVAPEMLHVAWQLAANRIVLVSDAVAAMGLGSSGPPTTAKEFGTSIARTSDGAIAGSVVGLDQCVRNVVTYTSAAPLEAAEAASAAPARALGLLDRGHLGAGARADLILMTDDLEVVMTIIGGQIAYDRR